VSPKFVQEAANLIKIDNEVNYFEFPTTHSGIMDSQEVISLILEFLK